MADFFRKANRSHRTIPLSRRQYLKVAGSSVSVASLAGCIGKSPLSKAKEGPDTTVWDFETGDDVRSSPTIVDGTVYVGSNDSHLYAIDAETGEEQWRFKTGDAVDSSPAVVDGSVYVASRDRRVYAVDATTGTERWRFEVGTPRTIESEFSRQKLVSSPTVVEESVIVGSRDSFVYSLDKNDGERNWRTQTGWQVSASPVVHSNSIFVESNDGRAYSLNFATGKINWTFDTGRSRDAKASPTLVDGSVYAGIGAKLYSLNSTNGLDQWSLNDYSYISTPTVFDDKLFRGGKNGEVYAARLPPKQEEGVHAEGEKVWNYETREYVNSSPTVAESTVFVGSSDGDIYALGMSEGDRQWSFSTEDPVRSSPTVVDGILYVGSDDGSVYALDTGLEGSSEGTRVGLGTLGHHHTWDGTMPTS